MFFLFGHFQKRTARNEIIIISQELTMFRTNPRANTVLKLRANAVITIMMH